MKARISETARRIMSNPAQARELVKQAYIAQRSAHPGQIKVGADTYRITRVTDSRNNTEG